MKSICPICRHALIAEGDPVLAPQLRAAQPALDAADERLAEAIDLQRWGILYLPEAPDTTTNLGLARHNFERVRAALRDGRDRLDRARQRLGLLSR